MTTQYKAVALACLCLALNLGGCALFDASSDPDAETNDRTDAGEDISSSDVDDTDTEDAEDADDPDACIPQTCPEGEVGEFEDGCGATIECAPCQDGTVQLPSCGTCGLGQRICTPGETGEGSCNFELGDVIAGFDAELCEELLVFVDTKTGDDTNHDGSRAQPFKTYARASAVGYTPAVIILGTGPTSAHHFDEPLIVQDGISVIGGFSAPKGFLWTGEPSVFSVPASPENDVFGLKASGINAQSTHLAHLRIATAAAPVGHNNYGAYIFDSHTLFLESLTVQSGKAGDGADGQAGEPGSMGEHGQSALNLTIRSVELQDRPTAYYFDPPKGAPEAGESTDDEVAPNCRNTAGGDGGQGLFIHPVSDAEEAPEDGGAAPHSLTQGGTAGSSSGINGGDGKDGAPVLAMNTNGVGGVTGEYGGVFISNDWVPSGTGASGGFGTPGNGGGGGGGAYTKTSSAASLVAASPGAGGGGGGCGGLGGQGGEPGGGSFGLVLIDSEITLKNSTFRAGKGGIGGKGGDGGQGGSGGAGGLGGSDWIRDTGARVANGATSGNGGAGSAGTQGGAGGGGAGGVSYGGYCSSESVIHDGTDVEFFSSETAARGGPGGLGAAASGGSSPGNPGDAGMIKAQWGCD